MAWGPNRVVRIVETVESSTRPIHVVTDDGNAFIKTAETDQGPDALVSEFVGTKLAEWLGLRTAPCCLVKLDGGIVSSDTVFASKALDVRAWSGESLELSELADPDDLARLVVLDTWTANPDRYPGLGTRPRPDNVFFDDSGRKSFLVALDQSSCFRGGKALHENLLSIEQRRSERVLGLFPQFFPFVRDGAVRAALAKLGTFRAEYIAPIMASVPSSWIRERVRESLTDFCVDRARFLAVSGERIILDARAGQRTLPF